MIVNERDHLRNGRSSSAAAKYADAFLRISLAVRNSRFSRSNSLIRSFSALVSPSRWPALRSACWHQARRLSGESPASGQSPDRLRCHWRIHHDGHGKAEHRVREVRPDRRGCISSGSWAHPSSVTPSGKPGAVHTEQIFRPLASLQKFVQQFLGNRHCLCSSQEAWTQSATHRRPDTLHRLRPTLDAAFR